MNEDRQRLADLHSAGEIVRHTSPFSDLSVPVISDRADKAYADAWVKPFCMVSLGGRSIASTGDTMSKFIEFYRNLKPEIDDAAITTLLSYFNWRPRITGAYFVAIDRRHEHCDHIGKLLLRSDLCAAGSGYALALARLNSERSRDFLCRYLAYYLDQPELYFDQGTVMGALVYTDQVNQTAVHKNYLTQWNQFVADKPSWDFQSSVDRFSTQMSAIRQIADEAS